MSQNLSMVKKFATIMKVYVKTKYHVGALPIIMTSPYMIKHDIGVVSPNVLPVGGSKKKQSHTFAICDIVGLSDEKMYMVFPAVFVQDVDAFIVQDLCYHLIKLISYLQK